MKLSRRNVTRVLVGAPVAAAASMGLLRDLLGANEARAAGQAASAGADPASTPAEPDETPLARFLARQEDDLTSEQRRRVRKQVAQMEQSLREVRAFILGNEVPPSGSFKALRSGRRGGVR